MSADAYEREYMAGKGAVLYRHKVHAPRWAMALAAGLPFGIAAISSAFLAITGAPIFAALAPLLGGALYAAGMTGILVVFAGGRIAVSEGELHVQIGPAGPRIPIDDIVACDVGASGVRNYGLGVKLRPGATIYSLLGDYRHAVRITRKDGSRIVLVCREPEKVAAAIAEARARRAGSIPKTRIELAEEVPEESELDAAPAKRVER